MAGTKSVDEIVGAMKALDEAIRGLDEEERDGLRAQMAKIDELMEDLEDMLDLIRARSETRIPYEDFLAELRAEGRDV